MGFVATLRFDNDSGGILGDEESWHLRRNKTYINDSVHPLMDSETKEKYGVDLIYAGAGTPSFHKMVIEKSKKENDFIYPYNLARTLLTEDQVFLYVKYGGPYWGTHKDDMPAWKRKYNDAEIRSVAHYVKTKMKQLSNKK